MTRPDFSEISNGRAFNRWYWLKEEMIKICKEAGLPTYGSKFELRDRIMHALDHDGEVLVLKKEKRPSSTFNWAKAKLNLDTVITDSVSFGPNFRKFMKGHLGKKFTCHSDFMDWVKENTGKTLKDAVEAWELLEARKEDPTFEREIADHNMLSQYVRDFLKDNKGKTTKDALQCWKVKKGLPTDDGFIRYDRSDLGLLR